MEQSEITPRQTAAFRRFIMLLPARGDWTLLVLKAHLLIEEQIRELIDERMQAPIALKDARLSVHQATCVAQALCPLPDEPWIWASVKRLNQIRNRIAHRAEPGPIEGEIIDFVRQFPSFFNSEDIDMELYERFTLTLWSLFERLSSLVERPIAAAADEAS